MARIDDAEQAALNSSALKNPVVGDQWNERVYIPVLVVVARFFKYVFTYDARDGLDVRTLAEFQKYLSYSNSDRGTWADVVRGNPVAEKLAHSRTELLKFVLKRRGRVFKKRLLNCFNWNGQFRFLNHQFTIKRLP